MTVLVVDDELLNRELAKEALADAGIATVEAEDGLAALALLDQHDIHLVLLDVMMPRLDGLGTLARIRERWDRNELPVVMATAVADSERIARALQAGANDYIVKPLDLAVMVARVRTQLEARDLQRRLRVRMDDVHDAFGRFVGRSIRDAILTAAAAEERTERRAITILFADLRGFSRVASSLPPERVVQLVNTWAQHATDAIESVGGSVDELQGDGILAFFGAPDPLTDPQVAGLRAAVAIQLRMEAVQAQLADLELPPIDAGIGLHHGEVVVGAVGARQRRKYGAVGHAINVAGRLCSLAVGGRILASEAVVSAAPGASCRATHQVVVKGSEEPVQVHDVCAFDGQRLPDAVRTLDAATWRPAGMGLVEGARVAEETLEVQVAQAGPRTLLVRAATLPPVFQAVVLHRQGAIAGRVAGHHDGLAEVVLDLVTADAFGAWWGTASRG